MTKKQLQVLKTTDAWTHQPEHRDWLSPTSLQRLWFVLLSCPILSITSSFSFPLYSSWFVKEGTIFAFPSGKSALPGWGREPFSNGKGRTAKCLGDAPKALTLFLKTRNSLLVTLRSSDQEGCPCQRRYIDDKWPSHHHPSWQEVTAKLPLLSLAFFSLTLQRFCRLQQSNCIIPANGNVMFHHWLPQSLESILT